MRVALSVALLTLCIGAAHADSGQVSPVATVKFVSESYKFGGLRPDLGFWVRYRPPFLEVAWQRRVDLGGTLPPRVEDEKVSIDLRYAHFDPWNDGRRDRNVVVVDCWNDFPCFGDDLRQRSFGHGEIDYLVSKYASDPIADALNHLAAAHEKSRPARTFE